MYLALELGTIDLNPVLKGVVATVLYFVVGMVVLVLGFIMVDVLTPGKLRQTGLRRPPPQRRRCSPARCTSRWPS